MLPSYKLLLVFLETSSSIWSTSMLKYRAVKTHFHHGLNKSTMYFAHYISSTLITVTPLFGGKNLIIHKLSNIRMFICVLLSKLHICLSYNSFLEKLLSLVYSNDVNIEFYNGFKVISRIDGSLPSQDTGQLNVFIYVDKLC